MAPFTCANKQIFALLFARVWIAGEHLVSILYLHFTDDRICSTINPFWFQLISNVTMVPRSRRLALCIFLPQYILKLFVMLSGICYLANMKSKEKNENMFLYFIMMRQSPICLACCVNNLFIYLAKLQTFSKQNWRYIFSCFI